MYQIVNLLANGKLVTWGDSDCDLVIELPEEASQHEFKSFDRVLVRNTEDFRKGCEMIWVSRLYDYKGTHYPDKSRHWCQDGCSYTDCIPYEGNEYLVGTTDKPKEC